MATKRTAEYQGAGWYSISFSDGGQGWTNDGPIWLDSEIDYDDEMAAAEFAGSDTSLPVSEYLGDGDAPVRESARKKAFVAGYMAALRKVGTRKNVAYTNPWGSESVEKYDVYLALLQSERIEVTLDDPGDAPQGEDDEQWAFPYMGLHYHVSAKYEDYNVYFNLSCMVEEGKGFWQPSSEVSHLQISSPSGLQTYDFDNEAADCIGSIRGGYSFWTDVENVGGFDSNEVIGEFVDNYCDFLDVAAGFIADEINYQSVMNAAAARKARRKSAYRKRR